VNTQTNSSRFNQIFRAYYRGLCLTLLAVAQIAFVSGCAVTPKYPSRLPAFTPGEEKLTSCPIIAGRYADKGEAFTVEGQSIGEVSLSKLLYGDNPAWASADIVRVLEPEPDVIEIQCFKQGQSLAAHRFSKYTWAKGWNWDSRVLGQPYYCVKGFVELGSGTESHTGAPALGMYVTEKGFLWRKAVDGSLIALQNESILGIAVIVPFRVRRCTWCRFTPLGDDFQEQPSRVK